MYALVFDVGGADPVDLHEAAAGLPTGRSTVDLVAPELEYPLYLWKLNNSDWFPADDVQLTADRGVRRSYACDRGDPSAGARWGHENSAHRRSLCGSLPRTGEIEYHCSNRALKHLIYVHRTCR
jgi:hypothetical protein